MWTYFDFLVTFFDDYSNSEKYGFRLFLEFRNNEKIDWQGAAVVQGGLDG